MLVGPRRGRLYLCLVWEFDVEGEQNNRRNVCIFCSHMYSWEMFFKKKNSRIVNDVHHWYWVTSLCRISVIFLNFLNTNLSWARDFFCRDKSIISEIILFLFRDIYKWQLLSKKKYEQMVNELYHRNWLTTLCRISFIFLKF